MDIPVPQWSISPDRQLIAGLIFAAVLVAALVYAVRAARQARQPYPVYIVLASGSIVFGEPFVDVLGHCAFPEQGATPYVHAFGRAVGLYMAPVYFFYFGVGILVTLRLIQGGVTVRRWWRWYAGTVAFGLLFEPLPILNGWWTYYGPNQPLKFFGLPIWWGVANTAAWLVTGTILYVLLSRRLLAGIGTLAVIPLLPLIYMGSHTMMAFPIYVALNSSDSVVVTNLAQLATIAAAIAAVWACGRLVAVDRVTRAPAQTPATATVAA